MMENNINSPSFRTSVGGYNRGDVNAYIMEVNSRFKKALRAGEERIKQLEEEINEKNAEIRELSKSVGRNFYGGANGRLSREMTDGRNRLSDNFENFYNDIAASRDDIFNSMTPISEIAENLGISAEDGENRETDEDVDMISSLTDKLAKSDALISALNERIEKLREQYEDVSNQLMISKERVKELENDNGQSEIISLSDDEKNKAVMYDKLTSQVGKIILDAQQTADAMIQNAERRSDDIISKAETSLSIARESADSIIKDAEKRSRDKIALADIGIKESIVHFKSKFMTAVNEYFDDVDSAAEKLSSEAAERCGETTASQCKAETDGSV